MTYQKFSTKLAYISLVIVLIYYMLDMTSSMQEGKNMYQTIYSEEPDSNLGLIIGYLVYLATSIFYAQYFKKQIVRGLIIFIFGLSIPFLFLIVTLMYSDPLNLPIEFGHMLVFTHVYVILLYILIVPILLLTKLLLEKE